VSAPPKPATYQEFLEARGITDTACMTDADRDAAVRMRDLHQSQLTSIVEQVETEHRAELHADERRAFDRAADQVRLFDGLASMRTRGDNVRDLRVKYGTHGTERASVLGEARTYERGNRSASWVRDMFAVATGQDVHGEARDRLARNSRELEVENRALSTGAGAGGEFAPPGWLINEYVAAVRAARPVADRVRGQQLPMGISSVNIPRIATGTAVAQQATQNTAVQNTDATTSSITAAIVTLAGQQVVSQQELDQSPINVDELLLEDLVADYAAKVDLFVLNNNATNAKGLLNVAGAGTQTYTRTLAPGDTAALYSQIAQAINTVNTARLLGADTIVMHPRRWAAFTAAVDTTGRPLVLPAAQNPTNSEGIKVGNAAQGVVGQLQGLDVLVDSQIPTNLGAGTNQDAIIVMRAADQVLWEGSIRAEAFRETKADQLSVLLRVYNYAAFTTRLPGSICVISGTGLITPVFGN
jgi:HK97 family phage major capsid protein